MSGNLKTPGFNFNKYEQYLAKEWTAGTEKLEGFAYMQKVLSNMSHNLKAFVNKVHTYLFEKTQSNERKWFGNEKIFNHIDKKLTALTNSLTDLDQLQVGSKLVMETIAMTVDELQTVFKSMDKGGISSNQIQKMQSKLDFAGNRLAEFKKSDTLLETRGVKVTTREEKEVELEELSREKEKLENARLIEAQKNAEETQENAKKLKAMGDALIHALIYGQEKEDSMEDKGEVTETNPATEQKVSQDDFDLNMSTNQEVSDVEPKAYEAEDADHLTSTLSKEDWQKIAADRKEIKEGIQQLKQAIAADVTLLISDFVEQKPSRSSFWNVINAFSGTDFFAEMNLETLKRQLTVNFDELSTKELEESFQELKIMVNDGFENTTMPDTIQNRLNTVGKYFETLNKFEKKAL